MSLVISAAPPIVTAWVSYVPTSTTWVANSTFTGFWRRVGDTIEVQMKVAVSGAPSAAVLTMSLPNGLTMDSSKMVLSNGLLQLSGVGIATDNSAGLYYPCYPYAIPGTSTSELRFSTVSIGVFSGTQYPNGNDVGSAIPFTWANLDSLTATAHVPITGWGVTV